MGDSIDFRELVNALPDMVAVASPGVDHFEWVSARWTEVLGWTFEELTTRPFVDFVHPDDIARTAETARDGHNDGPLSTFTNRYRHRDGGWRWLEWNSSALSDGRTYGVARDVTESRLERIRTVTTAYQSIMERIGKIGFWRSDSVTGETFWSPQAYAMIGLDPEGTAPGVEESLNRIHPADRERAMQLWAAAGAEGAPFEVEVRLALESGAARVVRVVGEPERGPSGELLAYVGVVQDISEQKLVEGRLRESEKLAGIGTMAAGVAHEINNPLSYVYAYGQFLREALEELAGPSPSEQLKDLISMAEDIEDGARRIRSIVRGLKSFSRTADDVPRALELGSLVHTASRLSRNELSHHADLQIDVAEGLPMVFVDESQMVQVLVNLIGNAGHAVATAARPGGQRVSVRAFPTEGGVAVEVEDDGDGMSEAVRARAFEPFFTTKPHGVGTGLGLSISHGIVKRFGGSIDIRSKVGEGTCVRLELPKAPVDAMLAERPAPAAPKPTTRTGRVLIVDDDVAVTQATGWLLAGHEVVRESDPHAGLQRMLQEDFDVILCDVMMPALGGAAIARALEEQRPAVLKQMVWITGGVFTPSAKGLVSATRQPVLEKPLEPNELRALVASMIGDEGR